MKKIIVLTLLALLLCGCSKQYLELGYSKSEAKVISGLDKDNQAFFSANFKDFYKQLFDEETFNKENLETYLLFDGVLDGKSTVLMVNDETIGKDNYGRVKRLSESKDFDVSKMNDYLSFDVKYNPELIVKVVNNNLVDKLDYIDELLKDKMFIISNLDLYIKYKNEKENIRDLIEYVNSKNYLTYYKEQTPADNEKYGNQVLVNKFNYLEKDYIPNDLVEIETGYGAGKLRKEAYQAYKKMQDEANKEGLSFYIASAFRSYETQDRIYNSYLLIDPKEEVDIYSARPGSSEHQLGLAVDILKAGYDFDTFFMAPEAKWLSENSYKYGFILRYPEEKVAITGYKYEPWHFRYLGDIAEDVYMANVTYDEYFEKFIKWTCRQYKFSFSIECYE